MPSWRKLGVIAGGGELPVLLAEHCAAQNEPYFIARIEPYADTALASHPGVTHGLGLMGARMQALRDAGCDAIVILGQVPRPDVSKLQLDEAAIAMAPSVLAAARNGDDALLRALVTEHEKAGFRVVGVEEAMQGLLAPAGLWGKVAPSDRQMNDVKKAAKLAAAVGAWDVGQGVVVCDGLVLAVEAQEGTDAMLRRVSELPATVRGTNEARRGVLVKRPKPIQERRIDLPTVGVRTVEGAAAAGLAGIAVEAGAALALRRDEMIVAADAAGIFILGFDAVAMGAP